MSGMFETDGLVARSRGVHRRRLLCPFRALNSADIGTQGDAPRLRRCALPWADMLRPLRGEEAHDVPAGYYIFPGLFHGPWNANATSSQKKTSTPGRIRTCDPRFRKPVLYPLSYGGVAVSLLEIGFVELGHAILTAATVHRHARFADSLMGTCLHRDGYRSV